MLRFVFGRSGSGKTEYCFSQIEQLVKSGVDSVLLITPEQYNFTAERRLLRTLGEADIRKVENLSFSRLNNEVSRQFGGNELPVISKGAKAVLMKKAVDSVRGQLTIFNSKTDTSSFITNMIKIYDEMKSCDISSDDLLCVSKTVEKEILSLKLSDMSLIIKAYEKLLDGTYFDPSDELTRLYDKLIKSDYLNGKIVFIDGFNGFVANEYKILELIIKSASNVTVTLAADSFDSKDGYSLFSYVNKNAKTLKNIADKNKIPVKVVRLEKNYRTSDDALVFCEKNLFTSTAEMKGVPDSVSIYSAKSVSDECEYIAREIKKELRAGRKAEKIAVICRNADKYSGEISAAFRKYEIPFFDDERQPVAAQPLIVFVKYLLRTVIYSFRSEDLLSLAKTGLTDLKSDSISELENYIYLWSISGIGKWNVPFTASTKGFTAQISESDRKRLDSVNSSREYLFSRTERFKYAVNNDSTARGIGSAVYNALIAFNVNKNVKKIAEQLNTFGKNALAEEQGRVWDILMESLNRLAVILGDAEISVKEYLSLFSIMISCEDLGVLPQGLDNVQFGRADRIRADNPESVYILGAEEGEFPMAVSSGGFLSETERVVLSNSNLELYSFGETLNRQERYFAYMAVSAPSEKLCVAYLGNTATPAPSVIVTSIRSLFPDLKEIKHSDIDDIERIESRASAFELMAEKFNSNTRFSESLKEYFKDDERYNAVRLLSENDEVRISNTDTATKLFGKDMYLSASRLEDFFSCRFRYFCKFGLSARPRERARMDAMKTGTVIHYVLENIISETGSAALSRMDASQLRQLVDKYLSDYLDHEMGTDDLSVRFSYQFMRISKMLYRVVHRLCEEFSQSRFKPEAFELNIDTDGQVQPKVISLENGGTVRIRGEVDRVDVFEENGIRYVRVIDYKSGYKKFSLSDILYGLNLQMFVYLFTLCSDKKSSFYGVPAGVLYMHASRSVFGLDRTADSDSVSKEETKEFKMKGLVLYDDEHDILNAMEKELAGKYIPVKYSEKKGLTGCFASLEELGKIGKKVEHLIAEMGNLLQSGSISQNPVNGKNHDKTCEYCDYSDVCANRRIIEAREMKEMSDSEVIAVLKEG